LRATHILNVLFLSFMARSGLEILSAHPKLYTREDCRPGSEWLRLTRKQMPKGELWTSRDEEESFSSVIALPGHKNLGLGRHWHFVVAIAWIATGALYIALLFGTDEWRRIVPTSWSVFPDAWHALTTYLSFRIPEAAGYNALQLLSYFAVVFLLAPLMIATGAAMSPAIIGHFPRYLRLFGGRQRARRIHFLTLVAFGLFTVVHTAMVLIHGLPTEWSRIVLGAGASDKTLALVVGAIGLAAILALHIVATRRSLRAPTATKHVLDLIGTPVERLLASKLVSRQRYTQDDISFFRVNGRPPADDGYRQLASTGFAAYRLRIDGLVARPLDLTLAELRAMPKHTQITKHNCIQGWSAVAEWGGVSMADLLGRCEPLAEARYLVAYAFDDKSTSEPHPAGPGRYYEALDLDSARHPQTLLAYAMNGEPLPVAHGAPLRLRVEDQLGFKMVKYICRIELVADYTHIGDGEGGWREDVQHYFSRAGI
jgi:DMSO/TMAO reductase YedYZ molybdopterin-dependent catalytic subunit/thiosulfate reductase cytochrome b subunit